MRTLIAIQFKPDAQAKERLKHAELRKIAGIVRATAIAHS
jgi:hypothetical protein